MKRPTMLPCCLCERLFESRSLTQHHCLPKSKGGTIEDVELLCSSCHGMVHATYTNKTLAAMYPTLAKLKEAPELEKFLKWVRKQPATRKTPNKPRKRKI